MGTQDSHLRALNRLQIFSSGMQSLLDGCVAASADVSQGPWYQPSTWLSMWTKQEDKVLLFP